VATAPGQAAGQAAPGHVDVHQIRSAAGCGLGEMNSGHGVAVQIRVPPGRDARGQLGHLRGDLGDFQRYRGRAGHDSAAQVVITSLRPQGRAERAGSRLAAGVGAAPGEECGDSSAAQFPPVTGGPF